MDSICIGTFNVLDFSLLKGFYVLDFCQNLAYFDKIGISSINFSKLSVLAFSECRCFSGDCLPSFESIASQTIDYHK